MDNHQGVVTVPGGAQGDGNSPLLIPGKAGMTNQLFFSTIITPGRRRGLG